MKKLVLLIAALLAVAFVFSCNKHKPATLDYTGNPNQYEPHGLPGESQVGAPESEKKYHDTTGLDNSKVPPPAEGEKKPDETKKPAQEPKPNG